MGGHADKSCQCNEAAFVTPDSTWCDELGPAVPSDVEKLDSAFPDRFITHQPDRGALEQQLWGRIPCNPRGASMLTSLPSTACVPGCRSLKVDRMTSFVQGLTPSLRPFVIHQDPQTFPGAVQAARLVQESMAMATAPDSTPQAQKALVSSIQPSSSLADVITQQAKEL